MVSKTRKQCESGVYHVVLRGLSSKIKEVKRIFFYFLLVIRFAFNDFKGPVDLFG